jgi:hypothetical protein
MSPSLAGGSGQRSSTDWSALWFAQDAAARLVVGRDLAVHAANPNALALIENNAALSLRDGVLATRDRRAFAELSDVVTGAEPRASCAVVGAAVLVDAFALGPKRGSAVALTLRDLRASVQIECAELETMFGVTPGEHQVIVQLLKGFSSREIARVRQVDPHRPHPRQARLRQDRRQNPRPTLRPPAAVSVDPLKPVPACTIKTAPTGSPR